jgi:hypothetical protein
VARERVPAVDGRRGDRLSDWLVRLGGLLAAGFCSLSLFG